jgi:tripartite motif-containing protein 71
MKKISGLSTIAFNALLTFVILFTFTQVGATSVQTQFDRPKISPLISDPNTPQPDGELTRPDANHAFPVQTTQEGSTAANVLLGSPGLAFRYAQRFGETETGYFEDTNHFYEVRGVATQGSNVWIADSLGERILKFDSSGNFIKQLGKGGYRYGSGVTLDNIYDMAEDSTGNVWVLDNGAAYVVQFDSSGKAVKELGKAWNRGSGNDQFNGPINIVIDSSGNLYISDANFWDESGNNRVQVFDKDGAYLYTLGETGVAGSDNAHFRQPHGLAIYTDRLYVADAGNRRVQIFNLATPGAAVYEATIDVSSLPEDDDWTPEGVGVDADHIYVADQLKNRVLIFDRLTGAYAGLLGCCTGTGPYEFLRPVDISIDSLGNIYVGEVVNKRVQQYNNAHSYTRTYGTTGVPYLTDDYHYLYPSGVAVDAAGNIYITEQRGQRLIKLNASGVPQWTVGEPGINGIDDYHLHYPDGVAVDSKGKVYVANPGWGNRVTIYNSDGSYYGSIGGGDGGEGEYQFRGPEDVAISSTDMLYVADPNNNRVQVYNPDLTYHSTIGTTGVGGSDGTHFDWPHDVAAYLGGDVLVEDQNNHVIKRCNFNVSGWYCNPIVGETGVEGGDFGHLSWPVGVAADTQGKIYVADQWGGRVLVFDQNGAFLTSLGGWGGPRSGQMRQVEGLAVDKIGNLYTAELLNNRVQKFDLSLPNWRQINLNGFGVPSVWTDALREFNGSLYSAGRMSGAPLITRYDGTSWTNTYNQALEPDRYESFENLETFKNQLYATVFIYDPISETYPGAEIWRSSDGASWTKVVDQGFGDPTNWEIWAMQAFNDSLFAPTWSSTNTHGLEIWKSPSGDPGSWTRVVSNGFGNLNNVGIQAAQIYNSFLYMGTANSIQGGEIWRTPNGTDWSQVSTSGLGDGGNYRITGFADYSGYLYAGTAHSSGAGSEIWRCQVCDGSDWAQMVDNGFGNPATRVSTGLVVYHDKLIAIVGNSDTGLEVWQTANGLTWSQIGFAGLGDSNSYSVFDQTMVVYKDRFFFGTNSNYIGAKVWRLITDLVYLPMVRQSK